MLALMKHSVMIDGLMMTVNSDENDDASIII